MSPVDADVRRKVIERAGRCCEYCRMSEEDRIIPFQVDHIVAIKHSGNDDINNLCFACYKCNAYKGSNIASIDYETGNPVFLYHPRKQNWDDHFRLNGAVIEPLTAEGRVTVFLLRFNLSERIKRRQALIKLNRYPCQPSEST